MSSGKGVNKGSKNRDANGNAGGTGNIHLQKLPDDLLDAVYQHLSVADLARAKGATKATKKFLNKNLPRHLLSDQAARDREIKRLRKKIETISQTPYDGRFNYITSLLWQEYIAGAQADVLLSLVGSGLDADLLFHVFQGPAAKTEAFGPGVPLWVAPPSKTKEVLEKLILPEIPKLKHTRAYDRIDIMFTLIDTFIDRSEYKLGRDPYYLPMCRAAYHVFVALANTLTRKDIDTAMTDDSRIGGMASWATSWHRNLIPGLKPLEINNYLRRAFRTLWRAIKTAGSNAVAEKVKERTLAEAASVGFQDVASWFDDIYNSKYANDNKRNNKQHQVVGPQQLGATGTKWSFGKPPSGTRAGPSRQSPFGTQFHFGPFGGFRTPAGSTPAGPSSIQSPFEVQNPF